MIITSTNYSQVVKQILDGNGEVRMAVAFWGRGADELLKGRSGLTRIVCNLSMGGTNPKPIQQLRKMDNVEVKQYDRLHAKVLVGTDQALVGSANISSNGLNFEAQELVGWEEVGMLTRNADDIHDAEKWFDKIWSKSQPISDTDIVNAKISWEARRANRVLPFDRKSYGPFNLLEFTESDLADRRAVVAIYKGEVSREAKAVYRRQNVLAGTVVKSARLPPMYENWWSLLRRGTPVIDIYYGARSVKCYGVYSVLKTIKFKYKNGNHGDLKICERSVELFGRRFRNSEAVSFGSLLRPHIKLLWSKAKGDDEGRVIRLIDVARICGRRDAPATG